MSRELVTIQDIRLLSRLSAGDGFDVLSYSLKDYSPEKLGFLGSHRCLEVTISNENCNPRRISFFVKALPYELPPQLEYIQESRVFEKEVTFFRKIGPLLTQENTGSPWGPRCFLVKNDAIVLEDLSLLGFRIRGRILNEDLVRSGLRALASLHAASIATEERLSKTFREIFPSDFYETAFVQKNQRRRWFQAGQDAAVRIAEVMSLDGSRIPAAFGKIFDAVKSSENKVNVISHGDLWSNNLLFNDEDPPECRLVDFQLFRYSPIGHDLSQFFYLCTSRRFRETMEYEMLEYYHRELLGFLGNRGRDRGVDLGEILQGYEEQRLAACATAALYFPTVLLDGRRGAELLNHPETYEKYCFKDRKDFVLEEMGRDAFYDERIRETVRELVELSFEKLPSPS